jgi:hypothetical protein
MKNPKIKERGMTIYHGILIHDDSDTNDQRVADFVDCMDVESRAELLSASQHGGTITLSWQRATPFLWDREWVHVEFRDGSFDQWSVCNRPFQRRAPLPR